MAAEISPHAAQWSLDPECIFLNHGSFGACPLPVQEAQRLLRERMERQPLKFLFQDHEALWDKARRELAAFVNCEAQDLVFVSNATTGVNTVLDSLALKQGDQLLVTDHEYNACRNALEDAAFRRGAEVVVAQVPFPLESADQVLQSVFRSVTSKTRLLLVDHVTSQTALVLPVARLIWELKKHGIETLVDGAHAPGMLPLDLKALGAAYYTGNCHKWLCAPKGAGFLFVRRDKQDEIRPLVVSHGANSPRTDRSRFLLEFSWMGTADYTAWFCVPDAIHFLGGLLPEGWPQLMRQNRMLALKGRKALCDALGIAPPCPDALIGSMASIPLPDAKGDAPSPPHYIDPLQDEILRRFKIEVPVIPWPAWPKRVLRISCQIYNTEVQYDILAEALKTLL